MLVPRSVLAARKCGDTQSSRYALGGLCLTRHNDQPYAVATDGRKLVALTWQEPTAGSATGIDLTPRPGCEFTIPTAALDKVAACKIGAKSKKDLYRYIGVQEPADEKACTVPMMASDGDEAARFEPKMQAGRFPRWRDVVLAPRTDDITFCCDARLLVQLLEAITAHTGTADGPATVVLSLNRENSHSRPIAISAANGYGNKAVGVLMPLELDERPANRWQAEAEAEAAEVEPAADEPPPRTRAERKAAAAAEVAAIEPPAEIPAPEVEPPPAPAVEPVDNRPIGRRPREIAPPAPSPPTLAEVLAATAGSDEPIADEPAPEWLATARELVAAGSRDNWEAGNY